MPDESVARVFGDTSALKPSFARALARLGDRSIPPDLVVGPPLARDLLDLSHRLNRRIGLYVDRRGRIQRVILGSAHALDLPEFTRVRGARGRLRGVRLVATQLADAPLTDEERADLLELRFDLLALVADSPAGPAARFAHLAPGEGGALVVRTLPRIPLSVLERLSDGTLAPDEAARWAEMPAPLRPFLDRLDAELSAARPRAAAEKRGVRAVALFVHGGGRTADARRAELLALARTAGVEVVEIVEQRRPHPDPRTFLGRGRLRAALMRALELDADLLVCDPELSPSQARAIAAATDLKVIDRTMLILDIFAKHARSAEGKLQVELAQLRHAMPFLVGRGTMMSRLAGGIGGRGPGETKLEVDRRRARSRIADLERRLARIARRRAQRRRSRTRHEVPVVAIVGYTNAGKSTLLNALTGSSVLAEDKLFATLDPTVRRVRFPRDRHVLLLDTVGFIRNLPPDLRRAFAATLEEIADADLLLHVVDAGDPDRDQQMETVRAILADLGADEVPSILVFNKVDTIDEGLRARLAERFPAASFVQATDRRTARTLVRRIEDFLWSQDRLPEGPGAGSRDGQDEGAGQQGEPGAGGHPGSEPTAAEREGDPDLDQGVGGGPDPHHGRGPGEIDGAVREQGGGAQGDRVDVGQPGDGGGEVRPLLPEEAVGGPDGQVDPREQGAEP